MNRTLRFVVIVAVACGVAYLRGQQRHRAVTTSLTVPSQLAGAPTLADARRSHPTHLTQHLTTGDPPPAPPAGVFDLVRYPAAPGLLSAYLTPDPKDGQRHPAIVWITGGDCNSIGDVWGPADRSNDQSASAYRQAGIAMMFPSLRGGNDNPGGQEKYFGEVDDVLAAADYLAHQPWVDPLRIYLGGHSTGGTLALLASELTDRFRAVFCFGPVSDVRGYGDSLGPWPFDLTDKTEVALRGPGYWLKSVRSPTFVLEGQEPRSNIGELERMRATAGDLPALHWVAVPGKSHFSILAPANELIAQKILADTGPMPNIDITAADVAAISSN
jgi:dipeptidyl aminopeptidase/acylaminoacyl peptidase